ncbi:MAG: hypothetical protein OXU20_32810 [Myxococcales bacterium]|nr:hypothetical protein [Myxococcales bacterium]
MASTKTAVVVYHGHCFDGMCSAAAFTRLVRAVEGQLEVTYCGLDHQPGGSHVPDSVLTGDINAVVDFRYSVSPKLTYWFDHHETGLVGEQERAHFAADTTGRKHFDPTYGSCCRLIADRAEARFGVDMSVMEGMVASADVIDAARFPDAPSAVLIDTPAKQLMTVLEVHGNTRFLRTRIADLARGASLEDLVRDAKVQQLLAPLVAAHQRQCEVMRDKGILEAGVVYFDLVGASEERYNKFIPYWLFPECQYSVALTAGKTRVKVSVGSNPWAHEPRRHNIAELCGRFGGGGHPVVGAVSLRPDQLGRAREVASLITSTLRGPSKPS